MEKLLYSPYDYALIIHYHNMDVSEYMNMLKRIFRYDNLFIQSKYRYDEKKFILAVMNMLNYVSNKDKYLTEQEETHRDLETLGIERSYDLNESESYHFVFKEMRIRIVYINKSGCTKKKLRNLLSDLGYQRRTQKILRYIINCLLFYHIRVSYKNDTPCDITVTDTEETLYFKTL